mmetsp:Transcript_30719/g.57241  ORF Transcript_30719/g.57241 Transcript_30719/m.57241 type:complete len:361 (-) Transcript_30719:867-1949(-)
MCIPRQKVVKEPPAVTGYGIWNLAQRGDEAVLEKMLASEESTKEHLNCAYGISLRTPLMAAIHWGHSRRAVMLLQAGASINKQDRRGNTALLYAIEEKNSELTALLTSMEGLQLDLQNEDGYCALHYAVRNSDIALVRTLLGLGANINTQSNGGFTALFMAIDKNDNEMATHLMNHSAINLNVCNERGATALHWAAGNKDNTDIALALIKLGAKLDIRNEARYTALHHAARRRNHVLLQALVEAGANWRIKTLHMDLMAHQFKEMSFLRECVLKHLRWLSVKDYLMFLHLARFRVPHTVATPSPCDQQEQHGQQVHESGPINDVFSIYDLTRYIAAFLICPSDDDLALLHTSSTRRRTDS